MTTGGKVLTITAALLMGTLLYAGMVMAAAVARDGVMTVRVEDRHENFTLQIPLPGFVMEAGAAITPFVLDDLELEEVRDEIGEWGPMILAMAEELDEMPDATLVEVVDGPTRVRVTKDGGDLRVFVDEPGTLVDVSVPARAMLRSLEHILG